MKRCPTVWSVDYRSGTVGYKSTWPMTIGKRRISGVVLNVDRERMLVNRDICVLIRKARELVRTDSAFYQHRSRLIDPCGYDIIDTTPLMLAIRSENALEGEISAQVYRLMRVGLGRLIVRACVDFRFGLSMLQAIWSLMVHTENNIRRLIFLIRRIESRGIFKSWNSFAQSSILIITMWYSIMEIANLWFFFFSR